MALTAATYERSNGKSYQRHRRLLVSVVHLFFRLPYEILGGLTSFRPTNQQLYVSPVTSTSKQQIVWSSLKNESSFA
jgi:hypothetical protein